MCSWGEGHVQKFIFTFQSFIHLINPQIVINGLQISQPKRQILRKVTFFLQERY